MLGAFFFVNGWGKLGARGQLQGLVEVGLEAGQLHGLMVCGRISMASWHGQLFCGTLWCQWHGEAHGSQLELGSPCQLLGTFPTYGAHPHQQFLPNFFDMLLGNGHTYSEQSVLWEGHRNKLARLSRFGVRKAIADRAKIWHEASDGQHKHGLGQDTGPNWPPFQHVLGLCGIRALVEAENKNQVSPVLFKLVCCISLSNE